MNTLPKFVLPLFLMLAAIGAQALEIQPYSFAALSAAQQAGKPVALHFHASWCPTCWAQEKRFSEMKSDKDLDLTLLVVNYDNERELRKQLGVRSQSTFIVFKGNQETARSGGETDAAKLKAILKSAF